MTAELGQRNFKLRLEPLIVLESKELPPNLWDMPKDSLTGSPSGQDLDNLKIKVNDDCNRS